MVFFSKFFSLVTVTVFRSVLADSLDSISSPRVVTTVPEALLPPAALTITLAETGATSTSGAGLKALVHDGAQAGTVDGDLSSIGGGVALDIAFVNLITLS